MQKTVQNEVFSLIKYIVIIIFLAMVLRNYLFSPITVFGESMLPTFQDEDKVIISKVSSIDRFDIIVFRAPDADENYIKRVIGLPGDEVKVKDNVLYVNDIPYEEPYLPKNGYTGDFTLEEITEESTVPPDAYFVLGDNRPFSKDSRTFGFISKNSVSGEVKFRYSPLEGIGVPE